MLDKQNSFLDDLAAEIGYTATNTLVDLMGGRNLSVPVVAAPGHYLEKLIGISAFRILVREYGGTLVWIPEGRWRDVDRTWRRVAMLYVSGKNTREIAQVVGMTPEGVMKIYLKLEEANLIPIVGAAREIVLENTPPFLAENDSENPDVKIFRKKA